MPNLTESNPFKENLSSSFSCSSINVFHFSFQLTPVERYALKYLEATSDYLNLDEIENTEVRFYFHLK